MCDSEVAKKRDGYCWRQADVITIGVLVLLGTFRLDYKYEIEYQYDFRISIQLCSQSPHSSLLLTSCIGDYRYEIGVKCDNPMHKR